MKTLTALLLLLPILAGCSSGPIVKAQLDAEVKRLCAIDGGVKVYETVRLPAEKFNKYMDKGKFYLPTANEAKTNDDYIYESTMTILKNGSPSVRRYSDAVIRRSDGKIMGQLVIYGRVGGDVPSPMHDSSFSCPQFQSNVDIRTMVIISDPQ